MVSCLGVPLRCTRDNAVILVELFLDVVWSLRGRITCIFAFQGLHSYFLRLVEYVCYYPQGQQQCSKDSTVLTPSTFSAFLDIHRVLLQLECGPEVCGVLSLTYRGCGLLFVDSAL